MISIWLTQDETWQAKGRNQTSESDYVNWWRRLPGTTRSPTRATREESIPTVKEETKLSYYANNTPDTHRYINK